MVLKFILNLGISLGV